MQEHEEHPTQNAQSGSQDAQHAQPADGTQPIRHEHKVLSFVRRSGRLDARLQRAWDTYAGTYLLPLNAAEGSLDIRDDWRLTREWIHDTWGNAHPLVIEIGTGQGENIVAEGEYIEHPKYGMQFKSDAMLVDCLTYALIQLKKWLDENAKEGAEVMVEQDAIFQARVAVENGEKVFAIEPAAEIKVLIKSDAMIEK